MDAAIAQLRSDGAKIDATDVARLAPLEHKHINFMGRYTFSLADPVSKGELRPLRNPEEEFDLAV